MNDTKNLNANTSAMIQAVIAESVYLVEVVDAADNLLKIAWSGSDVEDAKACAMCWLKHMIRTMPKDSIIECTRNNAQTIDFTLMDNKSHEIMRISTFMLFCAGKKPKSLASRSVLAYKSWFTSPQMPEGFEDIDIEEAVSICVNEGWCIASTENGLVLGEGVTEREFPRRA